MFHPWLREVIDDLENGLGIEFTTSSLYRKDDDGVHGTTPLRGTDLIVRDLDVGRAIERYVNQRWMYDPTRPQKLVAMYHGDHPHLHIQVHPRTVRR